MIWKESIDDIVAHLSQFCEVDVIASEIAGSAPLEYEMIKSNGVVLVGTEDISDFATKQTTVIPGKLLPYIDMMPARRFAVTVGYRREHVNKLDITVEMIIERLTNLEVSLCNTYLMPVNVGKVIRDVEGNCWRKVIFSATSIFNVKPHKVGDQ